MELKLIFSHFMTGENTDCRSGKVKTAPNLPDRSVPKDPAPKSNISTLLKKPQIGPNNWKTSKLCKQTPTKSKKNSKTFEQTLQY